jgi:hypothetical protein
VGAAEFLHAHVAASLPVAGRAGIGVVFVDAHGRVARRVGRMVSDTPTHDLAAFRGIVYALWNARRLGSRRVVVHSDNPGVVAQIGGNRDVDPALVGPYLEARALLHAYRAARVEVQMTCWGREAQAAAEAAQGGDTDEMIEDLPLWAGRPIGQLSTA